MSTAKIPLAGVIGDPVGHSRSPRLHKHWLTTHGLIGDYVPLHVTPDDLDTVLSVLPKIGFVGANVTIPHKLAALSLADEVSETARQIGAANTLMFRPNGSIAADNTDGYGFLAHLQHTVPDWHPCHGPAVVFGAGGAARAVIFSLLDAGVPEIRLTNRTLSKAQMLRDSFGPSVTVVPWSDAAPAIDGAVLVVNTTSLGMQGADPFDVPLDGLTDRHIVYDLVYAPLETSLLQAARQAGARPVDGLGMLLHQGVPGFERWFGVRPVVDAATRAAVLS